MDWQFILALTIAIPIILVPVVLVWYVNLGGMYAAVRGGRRIGVFETIGRGVRIALAVMAPLAAYAAAIWFSLRNFGWQVALAVGLVLPFVILVPVLIWAAAASGLFQVVRDALRRRALARQRRTARIAGEPVRGELT